MKRFIFISVAVLSCIVATGQQKKASFETHADIIWAGVDRAGDILLVLKSGEIFKYDKEGKKLGTHGFKVAPTLMDPLDGTQSFFYLADSKMYGNLSSDMTTVTQSPLDPAFAITPWLVCPSLHELWILDSADFSIKKTKMHASSISLEAVLIHLPSKIIKDYTYMREYQNYLFLLDKNAGIHVFNTLGKFLKTIGEKNITYFGFLGEEVYYMKGKQLNFVDLYTNEKRTLPVPIACNFALLTDDRLYAVEASRVSVFEFKP